MNVAQTIEIKWDDGMHHVWRRNQDGSWILHLTDPAAPGGSLPRIGPYDAENICRVITTAANS